MNAWLLNTFIELKLTFRDRQALFWTYVFPLLFLFLFCAVFGRGNPKAVAGLMAGLLCISAMAAGFFSLGIELVTARERGVLRRYKLSPIHPLLLISSRLVANFLIALSSLLTQIGVAIVVYRMPIAGSFMAMMVMLSAGALAFLALGLLIASVAESVKVALALANLLFFPLMFLGGAAIPKFLLPPAIQKISRLTPSNYMVEGLGRIMVEGKSLSDSGAQLIVLSMTTVTALFIAAKLFRWESNEPLSWAKRAWVAAIALIFVLAALR
jgi:ABC-2 type transport system permease protein